MRLAGYPLGKLESLAAWLTALSWLLVAPGAMALECVVKESFVADSQPLQPVAVLPLQPAVRSIPTPIRVVGSGAGVPGRGATVGTPLRPARSAGEPPEDEAQLQKRAIWAAIGKRDLDSLAKVLPSNDGARREMLAQSYAIDWAFRASALPIVRQILEWDPSSMSNRIPNSNSQALQAVTRNWQGVERSGREGNPVPNPPSAHDELDLMRMLLDAGADPNGHGDDLTPLGYVASMPASADTTLAAKMLLERGASLEKNSPNGRSALSMAAEQQNAELVRMMIQARRPSQDALDDAIVHSPLVASNAAIALLLAQGANINADGSQYGRGQAGFRPAWAASGRVKYEGERELMRLLIKYKVNPNAVVNETNSALMNVIHDHELMKGLLDLGANPNYRNYAGDTPLLLALRVPREVRKSPEDARPLDAIEPALDPAVRKESVRLLLKYGADPNVADAAGMTPLMLAGRDDSGIVDLLIARGGKLNLDEKALAPYQRDQAPVGPISWSLLRRNDHLAAALVRRDGASRLDDCGAIYYAAQTGATMTLAALLDRKADAHAASGSGGMTPLIVAASYGHATAVKILLDRRAANVNETVPLAGDRAGPNGFADIVPVAGQTALALAAARGHRAVVEELIKHGAGINHVDSAGQTALSYARRGGADAIVALLKAHGARE